MQAFQNMKAKYRPLIQDEHLSTLPRSSDCTGQDQALIVSPLKMKTEIQNLNFSFNHEYHVSQLVLCMVTNAWYTKVKQEIQN